MISGTRIPRHLFIAVSVLLFAVLGMSLYAWHMRGRAAATPIASSDTRPVVPPVAGPTERVTLFVAYDDIGVLHPQSAQIPLPSVRQQRAEELLRALLALYLDLSLIHICERFIRNPFQMRSPEQDQITARECTTTVYFAAKALQAGEAGGAPWR